MINNTEQPKINDTVGYAIAIQYKPFLNSKVSGHIEIIETLAKSINRVIDNSAPSTPVASVKGAEEAAKEFAGSNYKRRHSPKSWNDRYDGVMYGFQYASQQQSVPLVSAEEILSKNIPNYKDLTSEWKVIVSPKMNDSFSRKIIAAMHEFRNQQPAGTEIDADKLARCQSCGAFTSTDAGSDPMIEVRRLAKERFPTEGQSGNVFRAAGFEQGYCEAMNSNPSGSEMFTREQMEELIQFSRTEDMQQQSDFGIVSEFIKNNAPQPVSEGKEENKCTHNYPLKVEGESWECPNCKEIIN